MKPTEQQLQDIYEEAVSAECAEKRGEEMSSFDLLCKLDDAGGLATFIRTMIDTVRAKQQPELTVFYKSMPESNGKENWTAILHRKGEGIQDGMTIDRSEYPERVLYAADRVRYLIGEKAERPHILDYDADKRSDYVYPQLLAHALTAPEGWKLVPEEPTEQMIRAQYLKVSPTAVYKAMISAAPKPNKQ